MKKSIFLLCILLVCTQAGLYPPHRDIFILMDEPIEPYNRLWQAICQVESGGDTLAYNVREQATGIVQIRPCFLQDYNRDAHKSYHIEDCYKKIISKEIFMYYASRYSPCDYKLIAIFWNRSKTDKHWKEVKKQLEMR